MGDDFIHDKKFSVTVRFILCLCWFYYVECHVVRDVEYREVLKALGCYGNVGGCFVYYCKKCNEYVFRNLGCNSRLCSCCGKRHADKWALSLSKRMFKVPHRHLVLSIASELWPYLKNDRKLWKVYMDSAIDTLDDYLPKIIKQDIKVGAIVILHPFGKDMKFQPHLHLIITEGGFNEQNEFINKIFINAEGLASSWKYHVCKNLSKHGVPFNVTNWCFHNKRFYVWVHKDGRINNPKLIARYIGRYVRHPAIANSRIDGFANGIVKFHYENHDKQIININMTSDEFITNLIQHIPEKQFKMIRYYGAYSRRNRKTFKKHLQSSIEQTKLMIYGIELPEKIIYCTKCHTELEFIIYQAKPPPKDKTKIINWIDNNNQ